MNNADARKRRIDLLVRDLNRQLKIAADEKVAVDIEVEDVTKPSDKIKRIRVHVLEEEDNDSSSNRPVNKGTKATKNI